MPYPNERALRKAFALRLGQGDMIVPEKFQAVGSVAFGKTLSFYITSSADAHEVQTNKKDLSGNEWQITNSETLSSSFTERVCVIGFRTRKPGTGEAYSGYHTFSRFVNRYGLPYTTTPSMKADLSLFAQVDSSSSVLGFKLDGEWVS